MNISTKGLAFLTNHEGFRGHLYNDSKGYATIGYGHLVHKGLVGSDPQAERPFAKGLTQAEAATLLQHDLARFEACVRTFVTRPLAQYEYDALVSLAYNIGIGAFSSSTLVRTLNAGGGASAVAAAMMMWTKNPELVQRRKDEVRLFVHGEYT